MHRRSSPAFAGPLLASLLVACGGTGGSSTLTKSLSVAATSALKSALVDTGVTQCFGNTGPIEAPAAGAAFYGQDGQIAGLQPSYTLSSDGLTVKDNQTGLTWTRTPDLNGDGTIDAKDKLYQDEAAAYPATLNAKNFGGCSDWRLPTIKELYSLTLFTGREANPGAPSSDGSVPFMDTSVFKMGYGDLGAGDRIIDAQVATETIYADKVMNGQKAMFGFNFTDGRIKGYPADHSKKYYVYFVRGDADYGKNTFQDNGDGTITDRATGLMWSRMDSGKGMTWQDALAWAQTKNAEKHLGHTDWRVPNAKELQSLVDYTRSPGSTHSAAIDPAFACTSITNEAGKADYPCYWTSTPFGASDAVYIAFGRAMGFFLGGWIDVHGAGAQRSDPKVGDPSQFPQGHGPQGDAIRIYNFVRLVRNAS